jgi:hypothetical protein
MAVSKPLLTPKTQGGKEADGGNDGTNNGAGQYIPSHLSPPLIRGGDDGNDGSFLLSVEGRKLCTLDINQRKSEGR